MKKFLIVGFVLASLCAIAQTEKANGVEFEFEIQDGRATLTGTSAGSSIAGDLVLPQTLGGCPVTSIGECAFEYCRGLTSVTIPPSVTSIGDCAFSGCNGLTSVTIPSGVTSIGRLAFGCCHGLTSVTIPPGVTDIGFCAFADCRGLTSVTIPLSVTSIGDAAFAGCSGLTSVTIPPSVTNIGAGAFQGCSGLKTVRTGKGDSDRVKNLLESSGLDDVPKLNFIESPAPHSN